MLLDDTDDIYEVIQLTHGDTHSWLRDPATQDKQSHRQSNIALIHARFMETMLPSSDTKGKNIIYLLLKWTLTCLQACLYILVKERPFFGYIQRH